MLQLLLALWKIWDTRDKKVLQAVAVPPLDTIENIVSDLTLYMDT